MVVLVLIPLYYFRYDYVSMKICADLFGVASQVVLLSFDPLVREDPDMRVLHLVADNL